MDRSLPTLDDLRGKTQELLREARLAGYLSEWELKGRLRRLALSQSVDEIETLVNDLVATDAAPVDRPQTTLAILCERTFAAEELGNRPELVTILGTMKLSLPCSSSRPTGLVDLVTVLGETHVLVPPGIPVDIDVTTLGGACQVDPRVSRGPGGAVIRGVVVLGTLIVKPAS